MNRELHHNMQNYGLSPNRISDRAPILRFPEFQDVEMVIVLHSFFNGTENILFLISKEDWGMIKESILGFIGA